MNDNGMTKVTADDMTQLAALMLKLGKSPYAQDRAFSGSLSLFLAAHGCNMSIELFKLTFDWEFSKKLRDSNGDFDTLLQSLKGRK